MSRIFISYSRKDISFAQKIVDALAENHLDTWIDWKNIPEGKYISLNDETLLRTLGVSSVSFSPDGRYVASAGCEKWNNDGNCIQGSARAWESITVKEIARMTHHVLSSVVFSPAFPQNHLRFAYLESALW